MEKGNEKPAFLLLWSSEGGKGFGRNAKSSKKWKGMKMAAETVPLEIKRARLIGNDAMVGRA